MSIKYTDWHLLRVQFKSKMSARQIGFRRFYHSSMKSTTREKNSQAVPENSSGIGRKKEI